MAYWIFQCFILINYYLAYNRGYHHNPHPAYIEEDNRDYQPNPKSGQDSPKQGSLVPVNLPEECERIGICEDVPDYPQELVDRLLSQIDNTSIHFLVDDLTPAVSQRQYHPEDIELCSSEIKLIIPSAIRDLAGMWRFVLNNKEKPLQYLKVEVCHPTKKACSEYVHIPNVYEASCKQKYTLRRISIVGPDKKVMDDKFPIPTCCRCTLTNKLSKK